MKKEAKKKVIRLTLRTTLPESLLRTRIDGEFSIIPETSDFGMVMHNALDVDILKSAEAYREFHLGAHQNYAQRLGKEVLALQALKPDLILANIPYLTIDAASKCNIPCVAYCSLNWLEIFKHYFNGVFPEEKEIKKQMLDAYNRAAAFLCPAPSMPMPDLNNIINIGPVAKKNSNAIRLYEKIGCSPESKIILITPGGVHTPIPVEKWPEENNIIWLCGWPVKTTRQDIISSEKIDLSFNEILANCDAVITKPGYGTVTETACNQVPALYVKRGDWPEESHLVKWWEENACIAEISREALYAGDVIESLQLLWQKDYIYQVKPAGIEEACQILAKYIDG